MNKPFETFRVSYEGYNWGTYTFEVMTFHERGKTHDADVQAKFIKDAIDEALQRRTASETGEKSI